MKRDNSDIVFKSISLIVMEMIASRNELNNHYIMFHGLHTKVCFISHTNVGPMLRLIPKDRYNSTGIYVN